MKDQIHTGSEPEAMNETLMESKITRLLKNYSNARQSWEAWCFFVNFGCKNPDYDIVKYVDKHDLLFHMRYLTLKDFHIEAYKVLKKGRNNADNVFNLLKITSETCPDKKNEVNTCLDALEKKQKTIADICDIRDKYYAHMDIDYKKYLLTGTPLADIHECFVAIENSIIVIASKEILNSYLDKIPSRDDLSI